MRKQHQFEADLAATGQAPLSESAMQIALHMGEDAPMRLVVPVGDNGIFLIDDPRQPFNGMRRENVAEKSAVIELIQKRVISELPEETVMHKGSGRIGWREIFKGHEAVIPEGAKVFALRT